MHEKDARFHRASLLNRPMANRPLNAEEFTAFNEERKRLNKAFATRCKTMRVRYKVLCSACAYNAEHGIRIVYDCPNCRIRYWNNCSVRQVQSGEIVRKLRSLHANLEWVMAYNPDGTKGYEWHRHQPRYEQDSYGKWVPKE